MDSTFLEGWTEPRLILQHELRGADGVTAAQDWHTMWQPGPRKPGESQARYSMLHNGHLKRRQQNTSGFLLQWQFTAFYVTFLEIWRKKDEGCHLMVTSSLDTQGCH